MPAPKLIQDCGCMGGCEAADCDCIWDCACGPMDVAVCVVEGGPPPPCPRENALPTPEGRVLWDQCVGLGWLGLSWSWGAGLPPGIEARADGRPVKIEVWAGTDSAACGSVKLWERLQSATTPALACEDAPYFSRATLIDLLVTRADTCESSCPAGKTTWDPPHLCFRVVAIDVEDGDEILARCQMCLPNYDECCDPDDDSASGDDSSSGDDSGSDVVVWPPGGDDDGGSSSGSSGDDSSGGGDGDDNPLP